ATALNNLALLYHDLKQYRKAEPLYQRALDIAEVRLPRDHPLMAGYLGNLALLSVETGNPKKAARLFDRARRGARRHLADVLPLLSDRDRATLFRSGSPAADLEGALSLGLAHKEDADLAARSASWLVNGKANDQESRASSLLLLRQSRDASLGETARRLFAVRQELARLTMLTPVPGQEKEHARLYAKKVDEEQELGKQ